MALVKTQTIKTEITANAEVTKKLESACTAMSSVLQYCKEAAKHAVSAHKGKLSKVPFDQAIKTIRECYRAALGDKGDHNVLANFTDACTVLLAEETPISIEVKKGGDTEEVHMKAADAINQSKHAMKAAAKQVREIKGGARDRAGRKAKAEAPSKPVAIALTAKQKAANQIRTIKPVLLDGDALFFTALKIELAALGYNLTKKRK
jgi:hypothetical protein